MPESGTAHLAFLSQQSTWLWFVGGLISDWQREAHEACSCFQAFGKVDEDGSRYLLGDHLGNLLLLVLQHDGSHVVALKTEPLGCISAPSTISYLDNGVVYIGSSFGDSQLVRARSSTKSIN